jgi:hypothetical protein
MTDYSPFTGKARPPAAPPQLSRVLWTMRGERGRIITAGIYVVATGRGR